MSDDDSRQPGAKRRAPTQPMVRATDPDQGSPPTEEGDALEEVLEGTSYRALRQIGRGGLGEVYLAEHRELGRHFAVKVLRAELSPTPELVERFRREARAASQIRHPGVVDVTDFGLTGGGRAFVVMEHLEGQTLADRIEAEGPLAPRRALEIALDLCDALKAAHQLGVVHRDVKPDNIFLVGAEGRPSVKLVDFGLALAPEFLTDRLTGHGLVFGTPEYMSPEQVRAEGPPTASTDIYSLGVVIYEMLTATVPFAAETSVETMAAKLKGRPAPPSERGPSSSEITPALDEVVLRCLDPSPSGRHGSILEVSEAISLALDELELRSEPPEERPAPSPEARARSGRAWPFAAGLAALALLGGAALLTLDRPGAGAEPANSLSGQLGAMPTASTTPPLQQSPSPPPDAAPPRPDGGPPPPLRPGPRPAPVAEPVDAGPSAAELLAEGQRQLRSRQLDAARAAFERASRLGSGNAQAQGGLGQVAFEQGRYQDAVDHLEGALRSRPSDHRLRVLLGSAYLRLGQRQRAIEQWERVLEAAPDHLAARRSLEAVR